ncbi:cytochrome c [Sideroxyarcus emersonii]|uniref:c-type cytochrome n=1 Tax=Sideroxyarcus emersonii TaxID=2764705 RepID=UPI001F1FE968|nr:cytochrome c [Sideroxyarcus emersonii]
MAQAWPWSKDMSEQISVKPQESVNPANPGMATYPEHSVPVQGTASFVKDMEAADKQKNPVPATQKSVELGGRLFGIYCTPCHGYAGKGDGLVGQKLVLQPYNLTADQTKQRSDGFIWGMMTFGGAVMPPYANDLSPTERWHVVNYVRKVLQQGGTVQANVNGR